MGTRMAATHSITTSGVTMTGSLGSSSSNLAAEEPCHDGNEEHHHEAQRGT